MSIMVILSLVVGIAAIVYALYSFRARRIKRTCAGVIAAMFCFGCVGGVWAQHTSNTVLAATSANTSEATASEAEEEVDAAVYSVANQLVTNGLAEAQKAAEKAEAEEKAKAEVEEQERAEKSAEIQRNTALNTRVSEDDKGNYIAPNNLSDEEWNLMYGRMSPYARRDSLPAMQLVRNHFCGFANPVGLPLIVDYEWVEARFLGYAREEASDEVKEAAKKGKTLNLLDEKALKEAFDELDEKYEQWKDEFDALSHDEQELKLKLEVCEYILDNPIWAEQDLQMLEKEPYIVANYADTMKALREYFDSILKPKDENGKDIPLEQAEADGLGWNRIYEYAEGHKGEEEYRQTTLEYRKAVTPLCQIWFDYSYVGVTSKPLHRNWELKSGQLTAFLQTSLAKAIDDKEFYQFDLLAKDGKTVNLSSCINCRDSRLAEYKAKKTSAIQKGEPTYVPPSSSSKTTTTTPPSTTTILKDPAKGSGPSGNAQDFAGSNTTSDGSGTLENTDPATKHAGDGNDNNGGQVVVTDPNGGNTQGGTAPSTGTITGGNTNSDATGTDQGTGQDAKPSTENNSGKVSLD